MTSVSHVTAMYATKRRRRNSKNVRTVCTKNSPEDTNASKRHRERLNKELDNLAELLPYEQSVLSKLDKLSILRLSVSYLRTKSYFQAALASGRLAARSAHYPQTGSHHSSSSNNNNNHHHNQFRSHHQTQHQQLELHQANGGGGGHQLQPQGYPLELQAEGDLIVQALNGFLLILTCDGEVFYTSQTVETYLGFHQSDICHQSVYELVHSEDREELMQQLKWNSTLQSGAASHGNNTANGNPLALSQVGGGGGADSAARMSLQEILASADHRHLLERNFTVRFRCLLDNTSGFLRLDIRGRIKVLHGQQNQQNLGNSAGGQAAENKLTDGLQHQQREPMLAFFGVCIPFGPPSLLEMPSKDSVFKSKHRLDLSLISMDSRGKQLLGLNDLNYANHETFVGAHSAATGGGGGGGTGNSSPSGESKVSAVNVKLETGSSTNTTSAASLKAQQQALNAVKQKQNLSAYDLVHHDDLSYMASAHQELLKTGASGLIAYRMITQPEAKYQWLQTSAKLYYKNSKPDFILCTHRPLMEEEGRDLLGKRTMDFKVTYLDVGLTAPNANAGSSSSSSSTSSSSSLSFNESGKLLACDKLKSSPATHAQNTVATAAAAIRYVNSASPGDGSLASSRSITSLSPIGGQELKPKRKMQQHVSSAKYDLNQQPHYSTADELAYAAEYQSNGGSGEYKRPANGYNGNNSTFYDMDAGLADQEQPVTRVRGSGNKKKTSGNKSTAKGQPNPKKQKLAGEPVNGEQQATAAVAAAATMHHHNHQHNHHQQVDLYAHQYGQSHVQSSEQTPINSTLSDSNQAAYATAAAYAQHYGVSGAAGHQSVTAHHAHHPHHAYATHHHHHHQSLYGSNSAAAYNGHHHLHSLDAYGGHQTGYGSSSSAAAAAAAASHQATGTSYNSAAASGFLPATEHLLQQYSQSARTAAAAAQLAAWPSATATATGVDSQQYQAIGSGAGYQVASAWDTNAAVLAAAALTNGTSESSRITYTHQQQKSHTSAGSTGVSSKQQHGPASLNSDGSAHRSPLSSGESSNGSAFVGAGVNGLTAPTTTTTSSSELPVVGSSSTIVSPASYYLGADHHNQTNSAYATSYATHQNPYANASAMRQHYAVTTDQQYLGHQQQQQQQVSNQYQNVHATNQQQASLMGAADNHYHAYFHANGDAGATATGDSVATAAAIKLYGGSNGGQAEMGIGSSSSIDYYTPTATTADSWNQQPANSQVVYTPLQSSYPNYGSNSHYETMKSQKPIESANHWADPDGQSPEVGASAGTRTDCSKDNNNNNNIVAEDQGNGIDLKSSESMETTGQQSVNTNRVIGDDAQADRDNGEDFKDPLARLISSTIGDIMLDVAP